MKQLINNKIFKKAIEKALLFLFILTIISCGSRNKSIKSPYVSYYKGENTLLYFIKPQQLYSKNKNSVLIDFTFTDNTSPDTVTVNYTIEKSRSILKPEFYLTAKDFKFNLKVSEIIYREVNDNEVKTRYSSYISKKELLKLIESEEFEFISSTSDDIVIFKMKEKNIKKMNKLKNELLEILEMKLKKQ